MPTSRHKANCRSRWGTAAKPARHAASPRPENPQTRARQAPGRRSPHKKAANSHAAELRPNVGIPCCPFYQMRPRLRACPQFPLRRYTACPPSAQQTIRKIGDRALIKKTSALSSFRPGYLVAFARRLRSAPPAPPLRSLSCSPPAGVAGCGQSPAARRAGSAASFDTSGWYAATVPGTVLTTLVNNHVYPEPLYGENERPEIIPESLAHTSYWYRTVIRVPRVVQGPSRLAEL